MAAKKKASHGHDTVTADMLVVLQQIARGVGALREEMNAQLGELREEVSGLRADLKSYQRRTDAQVVDLAHEGADTGTAVVDLGKRVARLEEAVFKKTGS